LASIQRILFSPSSEHAATLARSAVRARAPPVLRLDPRPRIVTAKSARRPRDGAHPMGGWASSALHLFPLRLHSQAQRACGSREGSSEAFVVGPWTSVHRNHLNTPSVCRRTVPWQLHGSSSRSSD
jgi:hypothetical protein